MSENHPTAGSAKPPIHAKLEDCLAHYFSTFPLKGTRGSELAKRPMARFLDIGTASITRWIATKVANPVGAAQFKVMCFLELKGYQIRELEKKTPIIRGLIEILSYGVLSTEEIVQKLSYNDASELYSLLRGDTGFSDARKEIASVFVKQRLEDIDKAKAKWLAVVNDPDLDIESGPTPLTLVRPIAPEASEERRDFMIESTAHLILALRPLIERVVNADDETQRKLLRELTAKTGVFRLLDALSKLTTQMATDMADSS